MAHASESQHWYTRDGKPCYTVKAKAGHDRPATLADARKLGLVPGVSTIIGCCSKPGLEIWKIEQAILSALTLPRVDGETSEEFVARVKVDAKETARKAAERGAAIHAAIQGHYEGEQPTEEMWPYVKGASQEISMYFGGRGYRPEESFSHAIGFGGKADLVIEDSIVVDFKTKEFATAVGLKTWDEHAMQLAAYRHGLGMDKARCAIVYVSASVPGLCKLIELSHEELAKGWTMFYSLLHYWQAKNVYRSSFERMAA